VATSELAGKTCVVTGATSGIGLVAARELAGRGARILLVGRAPEKTEAAARSMREATGNPSIEPLLCDLSRPAQVAELAREIAGRTDRIDVLLNNAGMLPAKLEITPDGLERTFATNHLAYFVLTTGLLEVLKRTAGSRVVLVASDAHRIARAFDFDNLKGEKRFKALQVYAQSKLANLLFLSELARRLAGTGVTANALHPGVVRTNIFAIQSPLGLVSRFITRLGGLTPEKGAETSVYLATSPEVEGRSGGYYVRKKLVVPSAAARDHDAAARLWETSEKLAAEAGA
jgi:NAD(P)-dependent dehydrogenase (short-subunit alcohol dehydrogenase family)